jgi:hypothetical protein
MELGDWGAGGGLDDADGVHVTAWVEALTGGDLARLFCHTRPLMLLRAVTFSSHPLVHPERLVCATS